MKVNGLKEFTMVKGSSNGLMGRIIMDVGRIVEKMDMEYSQDQMGYSTRVHGKIANITEKEN